MSGKKDTTPRCVWVHDVGNWGDKWDSACGESWQFNDGGPRENKMRFCPYCGKRLTIGRGEDKL